MKCRQYNAPEARRQFFKLTALSALAVAARKLNRPLPPKDQPPAEIGFGTVTAWRITIRSEPSAKAEIVGRRYEDEIINLRSTVVSDGRPQHNRVGYEVADDTAAHPSSAWRARLLLLLGQRALGRASGRTTGAAPGIAGGRQMARVEFCFGGRQQRASAA